MADETWGRREGPILEAVIRLEGKPVQMNSDVIAAEAGIEDLVDAVIGIAALVRAEYLDGLDMTSLGDAVPQFLITAPREKARRSTGQWPSDDPVTNLVQLLESRIAATTDSEEKTKLKALRDSALGVSKAVVAGVLTELVKQQTGLA